MLRHCDGTDPNLIRKVRKGETPVGPWPDSVPCDCGAEFNDDNHLVVYPHQEF